MQAGNAVTIIVECPGCHQCTMHVFEQFRRQYGTCENLSCERLGITLTLEEHDDLTPGQFAGYAEQVKSYRAARIADLDTEPFEGVAS